MFKWIRARTEARNAREVHLAVIERSAALSRERALREQLDAALRDIVGYREKLGHMAEISGELSKRRAHMARDLEAMRLTLKQTQALLDEVRTVPELVLELSSEAGKVLAYERAERGGLERERSSISLARGAVRGMKVARTVAESRAEILIERVRQLRETPQQSTQNTPEDDEDTKPFSRPKLVK